MQALRYASRRALRATVVMQKPCIAPTRAYSSEAGGRVVVRLSKEKRYQLVKEFVENFKAANNGRLPLVSLLRKEVGGKYDVLKEVLEDFEKRPSEQVPKQEVPEPVESKKSSVELKETDAKGHEKVKEESSAVAKDAGKKKSLKQKEAGQEVATMQGQQDAEEKKKEFFESSKIGQKEKLLSKKEESSSLTDKKLTPEALKSLADVKSVTQTDAKSSIVIKKQNQSSVLPKHSFQALMDDLVTDEDNDDDSDIAAPEYQSPIMQTREDLAQASKIISKVGSITHSGEDDQAIKIKQQPKVQVEKVKIEGIGALKNVGQHPMTNKAVQQQFPDSSSGFGSKSIGQLPGTTVVRVVNLPAHVMANQLKSICESVARVHRVEWRRGRIADVHFNVDASEMPSIIDRMRKVSIGSTTLKVVWAPRFSYGDSGRFKPQNYHQFRTVRNSLIHSYEQRFKFLCLQVQDFRELHNLKVAK